MQPSLIGTLTDGTRSSAGVRRTEDFLKHADDAVKSEFTSLFEDVILGSLRKHPTNILGTVLLSFSLLSGCVLITLLPFPTTYPCSRWFFGRSDNQDV